MLEVVIANTLRLKARIAVRELGLPKDVASKVITAINAVKLEFADYYKVEDIKIKRIFIRKVLAGLDKVENKTTEEIYKCLAKKL